MKEVMIVVGAGQISMAIARRMGAGKKIILGDKNIENAKNIQKILWNIQDLMLKSWKLIYQVDKIF